MYTLSQNAHDSMRFSVVALVVAKGCFLGRGLSTLLFDWDDLCSIRLGAVNFSL